MTDSIGRTGDDRGSASLEFLSAGVLLLVPVVYLILTISTLQAAAFATEGAARFAARAYVQASGDAAGRASAARAVALTFSDLGVRGEPDIRVTCSPRAEECGRGSLVTVSVTVDVPLPFVPDAIAAAARVPVGAEAVQRVSGFAVR